MVVAGALAVEVGTPDVVDEPRSIEVKGGATSYQSRARTVNSGRVVLQTW